MEVRGIVTDSPRETALIDQPKAWLPALSLITLGRVLVYEVCVHEVDCTPSAAASVRTMPQVEKVETVEHEPRETPLKDGRLEVTDVSQK